MITILEHRARERCPWGQMFRYMRASVMTNDWTGSASMYTISPVSLASVLLSKPDISASPSGQLSQSRPLGSQSRGLGAHSPHYAEIAMWHTDTWCLRESETDWQEPFSSYTTACQSVLIIWNQPTWPECSSPMWITLLNGLASISKVSG